MGGGGGGGNNDAMAAIYQTQMNRQAALEQQRMNMISQTTPYGSLDYSSDPNSPSGYRATQRFSPELMGLLNSNIDTTRGALDFSRDFLSGNRDRMMKPLDLSYGANAERLADLSRKTLDPIWKQRQNDFDQSMADRGLTPGSTAYTNASRDFGMQRDNSYNDMFLRGYDTVSRNAAQEWMAPFNANASLRSNGQIAQPSMGLTQTPQGTIQPADFLGLYSDRQKMNAQRNAAAMGGMFGLGGSLISGLFGLAG